MHTRIVPRDQRPRTPASRKWSAIAASLAAVMVMAACSTGDNPAQTAASQTLRLGSSDQPGSLDPAKTSVSSRWYLDLAYDPLIYHAPDGSYQPRLATSWHYVGTGDRVFELHLRPNIIFSDGSRLTATVVKHNIDYQKAAHVHTTLGAVSSVDIVDPLTVRISMSKPDPDMPQVLSQDFLAGDITSGAALKNPTKLANQTYGAGPYMLDANQSVTNDHYTYVPNPHYWNKKAVHYQKIVIDVLPNPNTALDALKTGQVDVIQGSYSTATSARAAGLQVAYAPDLTEQMAIADRAGQLVPALRDLRVRRALNYAVDRHKITTALLRSYGTPTEQIEPPGGDGYNRNNFYTFDTAKAKKLLAEAGYPNGFTLPVITTSHDNLDTLTQAVAADFQAIGVHLQITNVSNYAQYLTEVSSGKWPAFMVGFGVLSVYRTGPALFLPTAAQWNPFRSSDSQIASLYTQAAAATEARQARLDTQLVERLVQQAWFIPVFLSPVFAFARSGIAGVQITAAQPLLDPVEFHPA